MLIVIVGRSCSGKTTVSKYIAETYNMIHVECSDLLNKKMANLKITDQNSFFDKFGKDYIAKVIYQDISTEDNYVISGFRTREEIWYAKNNYISCTIIYLYADSECCYKRYCERKRYTGTALSYLDFNKQYLLRDNQLGMLEASMGAKEYFIVNNNEYKELLYQDIDSVIKKIRR